MAPPVGFEVDDASLDEGSVATVGSVGSTTLVNEMSDTEEPDVGPAITEMEKGCCRVRFKTKEDDPFSRACRTAAGKCRRKGHKDRRAKGMVEQPGWHCAINNRTHTDGKMGAWMSEEDATSLLGRRSGSSWDACIPAQEKCCIVLVSRWAANNHPRLLVVSTRLCYDSSVMNLKCSKGLLSRMHGGAS